MSRIYRIVNIKDLPPADISHMHDICVGHSGEHECIERISVDGFYLFIKTTQELIDKKVNGGVSLDILFPADRTINYTYDEILSELTKPNWLAPFK